MKKEHLWTFIVTSLLVLCCNMTGFSQCVTGGFSPQFTGMSLTPGTFADPSLIPVPTAASDDNAGGLGCVVTVMETGVMSTNPANPDPCESYQINIEYIAQESDGSLDEVTGTLVAMIEPTMCIAEFTGDGNFTEQCMANAPPAPTAMDCAGNALTVTETSNTDNGGSGDNGDPLIITRTYEATSECGGTEMTTQMITIEDTTFPNAICMNITAQLDATGNVTIANDAVDNGSTDNCGIELYGVFPSSFDCSNIGANNVTMIIRDEGNNPSTCTAVVTVEENEDPIALCQNITIQLDIAGNATIAATDVDNGSNDNCGAVTLSIDVNTFDCTNIGANTVVLTATDGSGNTASCNATVTVEDNTAPQSICQNITVELDATGNITVPAADVDNGSNDACGIMSLTLSMSDFTCANIGANMVMLTVEDMNGNSSTCNATITVEDNMNPTATCMNFTAQLDAAGNVTITAADIDGGSTDNCNNTTLMITPSMFTCADVGINVVTLTVSDNNGNTAQCTADVTVEDNVAPTAICMGATVQLDAAGNAAITVADINNNSNDACGLGALSVAPNMFTCADLGNNTVTLTVNDANGNMSTCTATVVVEDNIDPMAMCQAITVQLDATGNVSIAGADVDNGSSDNCNVATLSVSPNTFTCDNIGNNNATLTVTDDAGNTMTCVAIVTVEDNIAPMAMCQNINANLDASGNVTVDPASVNNGSTDNCNDLTFMLSQSTFSCVNIGANNVTLTVTDGEGATATCTADITVADNVQPMAVCQNITINLDAGGNASIVAADIDGGSFDNCGIMSISASQTAFTCANAGDNTVVLTVNDVNGNSNTCNATVTVQENIDPDAMCMNATIQLDANGMATTMPADIDNGSSDNCGTVNFSISQSAVNCTNVGTLLVTLTVTDNSGNEDSCASFVTIEDNIDPTAVCNAFTLELDASGNATLMASDVDASTDACGIANVSLSQTAFTCADVGANTVTVTVTDNNGNMSMCDATVTVADSVDPIAMCMNATVQLDGAGNGSITTADIDNGSSDNCGAVTLSVSPNTFTCSEVGSNTVTLTVEDGSGNTATCDATVTVEDNIDPNEICQDITVQLDANGNATIDANAVDNGSTDACGIASFTVNPNMVTCDDIGMVMVTLTVTDNSGNMETCTAMVTVEDNVDPTATCQNISVELNDMGNATIAAADIDNGSNDNCSTVTLSIPPTTFTCADLGANTVTLTVEDANGNMATCDATVTVTESADNPRVVDCPDDIEIMTDGNCMVTVNYMEPSVIGCGYSLQSQTHASGDMFPQGTTMVEYVFGNGTTTLTCNFNITITDMGAGAQPMLDCGSLTGGVAANTNAGMCAADGFNLMPVMQNDDCGAGNLTLTYTISGATTGSGTGVIPMSQFFNTGVSNVTYVLTDNSGNSDQCSFTVTVNDAEMPTLDCSTYQPSVSAGADMNACTASNLTLTVNPMDNCSIENLTYELSGATTAMSLNTGINDASDESYNVGTTMVTYTAEDASGNATQCSFNVIISDDEDPMITCPAAAVLTVNTDPGTCSFLQQGTTFDATPSDNCPMVVIENDRTDTNTLMGETFPIGTTTVVWTATDNAGNEAMCTIDVIVDDNEDPQAMCMNITVQLDAAGNASISGADIDGGSTDNCGIMSLTANPNTFDCSNVGDNNVTLTVTDNSGNTDDCVAVVTVEDNVDPSASCVGVIPLTLSPAGVVTIVDSALDNGSSDACGIQSFVASQTTFTCDDVGNNMVTLTVTDNNGNTATCLTFIGVLDNTPPDAMCMNATVQLDAAGSVTITGATVDNGSSDACGVASLDVNPDTFTCTEVGDNNVTLTVTDVNGNSSTCTAVVTVEDTEDPEAICQNITIQLDANGDAMITANQVDNGSNDNCGSVTLAVSPNTFDCSNLGANTVTLTATDTDGNTDTCEATVTVEDPVSPVASCQNATIQLDADGNVTLDPNVINNGSSDACGVTMLSVAPNMFTCANVGSNMVTLTVEDASGNESTCTATVMVEDNTNPTAVCQNLTIELDATGNVTLTAAQVDNGSNDACGISSLTLDMTNFDCSNIGGTIVRLTVTDNNGNTSGCNSFVMIQDNLAPNAMCQNISASIGASGSVTITAAQIDNGSTDNCNVATLSVDPTTFTCDNVGNNTVTLTVTDDSGNSDTCDATVTVTDSNAPTAVCMNATVQLDDTGNVTLNPDQVDGGSSAPCGTMTLSVNPSTFTCANIGNNTVTLTVTANNGMTDDCMATVIVEDNVAPTAMCQNHTAALDATGNVTINASDVDDGSSDACGVASLSVAPNMFTCNEVGENTVTLTVTDTNGNDATCEATVTVEDNTSPNAICQNATIQLDVNGNASIVAADLNNGSNDACGIATVVAAQTDFTCANVGNNNVVLTVTDNNGNDATCNANVLVEDNINPTAVCQNITIQVDATGNATISGNDIDGGSNDACGIANLDAFPNTFTCADLGDNNVTLVVEDNNGNMATCTAVVTVEDDENPTALCQDITIQLDAAGNASITANQIDNGSNDNCGMVTLAVSPNAFDCSNMGENTVTLTVTDSDNNTATCEATVTIEDNVSPVAMCMDATIQLDADGNATLDPALVNDGSSDACGIIDTSVSPNMFTCANVGNNTVTLTVMDADGNSSSCDAMVMVEDNTNPTALCQDIDVELDATGNVTITAMQVDNGSSDACGVMSRTLDQFNFDCSNVGDNTVTLTVTDNNGNESTCTAVVTVNDNIDPMALCQDITVGVGASGSVTIMAAQVDNGSSDNCGTVTLAVNPNTFTCDDIGDNAVTLTVTDASGNEDTCTATVTVTDSSVPTAVCMNATIQLDATGNVTLAPSQVDGGSSAPCGSMDLSVSPNMFTCVELGDNTVTLTVADNNGMTDDCTATVTVEDNIAPVAMCQNITITLDNAGNQTIAPADIDNGSMDACGVASLSLSQTDFDCSDVGAVMVTLTATDGSGNEDMCDATVNVIASNACDTPTIKNTDGPNIADPCTCIGNGQFSEEVVITAMNSGQMWEVQSTTLIDPNTGNPYPAGTPFVEQPPMGGMVEYTLEGIHLDGQGYMLTATSPSFPGTVLEISNTCFYPDPVIVTDLSGAICAGSDPIVLEGNAGLMTNGDPIEGMGEFSINGNVVTEIDPTVLGTGTFQLVFTFDAGTAGSMNEDDPGCEETITTSFTIEETPDFQGCNDEVTVVLGPTCEAFITADVILEGDFGCVDDYEVTLFNEFGQQISNPITSIYLGQTLTGTVTHIPSGNFCSSPLIIEDSIEPTVQCQSITISCMDELPPITAGVLSFDNCDVNPQEILLNQVFNTDDNCTDNVPGDGIAGFVTVTRTYIAEDDGGLQSQPCDQIITITRPDDVDFPEDLTWSCEQYAANPNIIDPATLHPGIVAGFGTEFPAGANGFGFDLTSMNANDTRLTSNVPNSDPARPTGSGRPDVDTGTFCNYSVSSSENVIGICGFASSTDSPVFKIIRTWTVLDWCTGEVITMNDAGEDNVQVIIVMDAEGPTVTGVDVNLSTNIPATGTSQAAANGTIPMPTTTDNCTGVDNVQGTIYSDAGLLNSVATIDANGQISPPLSIGEYFIGYSATDVCGNTSQSVAYNLTIADNSIPTMICDEITEINVPSTGVATVPAGVFDDGSYDDCGMVTFTARRMSDNCGVAGNTTFNPTVTFCCADAAAGPITVVLQATDCDNNSNTCMITVNVGDKIAPTVACPSDATIDCDEYEATLRIPLQICNLDDNCESAALTNAGYGDVAVNDNCSATAQPTVTIAMDNCGNGTVTRSFMAVDASGNESGTCTQTITVNHASDWVVEFDEDVTLDCGSTTANVEDAFGTPEIFFETCEMIATSFEDETFTQVNDACFKVVRTWKVINWCVVGDNIDQEANAIELSETALGEDLNGDGVLNTRTFRDSYRGILPTSDNDVDADNQDGFITYIQTVKVIDEEAPVFMTGCVIPDVCISDNTCGAAVNLPMPTITDCVDASLVTLTVTSDLGIGFNFNNVAPGTYNVTYEATDNCGNMMPCNSTVTVNDCVFPSPICVEGLVVELMATNDPNNPGFEPMAEITPDMLNAGSSDNCPLSPGGLKLSFSPDISNVSRIFTCDSLGDRMVRLYVTDDAGLQDFCEIEVEVQANQGQCGPPMLTAMVAGNVATEAVADVEDVMVYINGTNNVAMNYMTDAAGMYDLEVPMDGDYTIVPVKDDEHGNGVTTFDLVRITKHILNIQDLGSPYRMIAADANNSQSITTLDLVHIRKLILLIDPQFTNNTSWRFVDADYVFPDPSNPWLEDFPEAININNLANDQMEEDFVAIKIGDVNDSATANQLLGADDRTETGALNLTTKNATLIAGESYAMTMTADNFNHFGYQFTLQFDTDKLAFDRIENGLATTDNFGTTLLKEGVLTTSWHQATATKLAKNEAMFTLHFTALANGRLAEALHIADNYTTAEAYAANGDLQTIELNFNQEITNDAFALYQNQPNPFSESTTIGFYLPTAQTAQLTITDLTGKIVYTLTQDFEQGRQAIQLNRSDIGARGVLYYRLETEDGAEVRKMIIE